MCADVPPRFDWGGREKGHRVHGLFVRVICIHTAMLAAMSIRQSYQSIGENPTPSAGQGFPIGLLIPLNCCVLPFAFVQRKLKAIPF